MNAFKVVGDFEQAVADYSGSKYAVAIDSCSNSLFLCCLYRKVKGEYVSIPKRTYVSVPCAIINAGGKVKFEDKKWEGTYELEPFKIVDGAKRFRRGMYEKGTLHCLSFHIKKHLALGRGGMILTDDKDAYDWLKMARFDGRHECALRDDNFEIIGWNFYMTPEIAARGMWLMMSMGDDNPDLKEIPDYPDLSKYEIYTGEGTK